MRITLNRDLVIRYRILLETAGIVAVVVVAKLALEAVNGEFVAVSPLHTSIVAGGIFILSIFLAGILPDYKEAERLPTEFAATVDSMFQDAIAIPRNHPGFDAAAFREALTSSLQAFRSDIVGNDRRAYAEIHEITDALVDMEGAGVPPPFISKLKQEQAALVRTILRLYYIQKTRFIPSAYYLVVSTAALVIGILLVSEFDPFGASLVALGLVAFIFIYLIRLIDIANTPFRSAGATQDDVSLFLVHEVLRRLEEQELVQRRSEGHDEQFYARLHEHGSAGDREREACEDGC